MPPTALPQPDLILQHEKITFIGGSPGRVRRFHLPTRPTRHDTESLAGIRTNGLAGFQAGPFGREQNLNDADCYKLHTDKHDKALPRKLSLLEPQR